MTTTYGTYRYSLRTCYANCYIFSSRNQISKADLERFAKAFRKCARSDLELTRDQFQKMVSSQNVRKAEKQIF